jgi:glycosyltransferase involved in cell wall biosynthesis
MTTPLISIIVPFCNEENYIADCVHSLINQTYKNIEIVLVNDHSTDNSKSICLNIDDKRIKYVEKSHIPKGEAFARNFGIQSASGDIITFLDADDTCVAERVELQLHKLLEVGIYNTICGSWVQKSGLENKLLRLPVNNKNIIRGFNRQYNRVTIVGATIMGAKKIFEQFSYRTKFKYYTDWDLLLRMYETKAINFVNVDIPLYNYIIRKKSTKYQTDWLDYNIFLRDCQFKRRKGKKEYESPEQMFNQTKSKEISKYFLYKSFQKLIQLKRFL